VGSDLQSSWDGRILASRAPSRNRDGGLARKIEGQSRHTNHRVPRAKRLKTRAISVLQGNANRSARRLQHDDPRVLRRLSKSQLQHAQEARTLGADGLPGRTWARACPRARRAPRPASPRARRRSTAPECDPRRRSGRAAAASVQIDLPRLEAGGLEPPPHAQKSPARSAWTYLYPTLGDRKGELVAAPPLTR